MNVVDKRTRKPRRTLEEVAPGEVVVVDSYEGFWLKRIYDSIDRCSLVGTRDGVTIFVSRNTEVTLVKATMTIEDGDF